MQQKQTGQLVKKRIVVFALCVVGALVFTYAAAVVYKATIGCPVCQLEKLPPRVQEILGRQQGGTDAKIENR